MKRSRFFLILLSAPTVIYAAEDRFSPQEYARIMLGIGIESGESAKEICDILNQDPELTDLPYSQELNLRMGSTLPVGHRPLHEAVNKNNVEVAELLIMRGADVNAPTPSGWTPLMLAVGEQREPMVRLLLKQHAALNTQNQHGETALMLAVRHRLPNVVQLLLDHQADLTIQNNNGFTASQLVPQALADLQADRRSRPRGYKQEESSKLATIKQMLEQHEAAAKEKKE